MVLLLIRVCWGTRAMVTGQIDLMLTIKAQKLGKRQHRRWWRQESGHGLKLD